MTDALSYRTEISLVQEDAANDTVGVPHDFEDTACMFHPVIDITTGVVYGYEAAFAGSGPDQRQTLKDRLDDACSRGDLPEAEIALLRKALRLFRDLPCAKGTKLFFNLDGRHLGAADDPRIRLAELAKSEGLAAGSLGVELIEREQDVFCDLADHALMTLRQSGVLLSLDDFGRGFSELRRLHDISPDYVKIDRFFLSGIDSDPRRRLFVKTVANLAHVLGARVIANGVETEREFKASRDAGCDLVQGPYVAAPVKSPKDARLFYDHIRSEVLSAPGRKGDRRIRGELMSPATISVDATMKDLLDLFLSDQDINVVPVLDINGEPRGLIHERDLKAYLYGHNAGEQDYGSALDLPLGRFVRACPLADIDSDADMLLVTFASSLQSDGIIITENFRYAGFLSATSLLKLIHEKRLQEAQDQNPLTRLPGNSAVTNFIMRAASERSGCRHLCYIDFDHFKPFNDTFGYRKGDQAIILFAQLLQKHVTEAGTFIGHLGGDDFFLGFSDWQDDDVKQRVLAAQRAFQTSVESFYKPEDRERGFIIAQDRFGSVRQFPLLDCSISILAIQEGITLCPDRLNAEITDLKCAAKKSETRLVVKTLAG
ncbi:EAL domain-containing protein [Roseibium aquae]|nr:EAL domain-containing protein [Roseibium aquae]